MWTQTNFIKRNVVHFHVCDKYNLEGRKKNDTHQGIFKHGILFQIVFEIRVCEIIYIVAPGILYLLLNGKNKISFPRDSFIYVYFLMLNSSFWTM